MTAAEDSPIRRRADGSIDVEFYLGRGRTCRAVAVSQRTAKLLRRLAGFLAISRRKPGAAH